MTWLLSILCLNAFAFLVMLRLGVSALFCLNFMVLQWFGVRLARVTCPNCERIRINVWKYRCKYHRRTFLLRWVWPLTGWWSDYRWIARRP